ncbi:hypothetical protein AGABI1DRAFT_105407 [Agaricus bisporus var. burnettii JB137-S8]|uniref:Uncharacterized protein n=1 Tax=Agaricus bisporus var. burnettii (strain JB137-S8 / ATCC MYA-4627 / FGSC 10392) TaxID=597362 RepID=K5XFM2_AGABU|nr:uncharacterized protein AGABI1DRAFT_105407 [Agaricus bisporus var. burnettii JB137-S8]EKM82032.1 hypothetical protein AGABI1DRAFT_105407 [Agaricus bisporus var. burnettii JB137-S8]
MPRFTIFLVDFSRFTLECISLWGFRNERSNLHNFSRSSDVVSGSSHLSTPVVSQYGPDEYERTSYYHGVTGDGDDPELVYRSDYSTTPFPKPSLIWGHTAVRSLRGVFDTPLNSVWDTVGPQIRDLIKARRIHWSSIDPARFFTHGPIGEEEKGRLGPVVIWVGVIPGSTSPDTAHDVSQEILALLLKNGVEDVVVEWREAVLQRLAGPPLMRHVVRSNDTHYVRRFLTALLGVPIAAEEMEDVQGTLTLWFHENKDKDGNPSDKVYGVSNCHVLRKNTTVDYEHRRGATMNYVRVCGSRRFQRGLDEIAEAIARHAVVADLKAREIVGLEAKERHDTDDARQLRASRRQLDEEKKAITQLETFHDEVCKNWSHVNLHRNIGYVQYTAGITTDVEGGTQYTSDWGAFLAAEAKVKPEFEGNVIDLGSKYSVVDLTRMFCARLDRPMTFKYPGSSKLQIVGCATKEDLANPAEFDRNGQRCLIVGKDGNSTDLTVGCYAGLPSFIINEVGVESVELGIYNTNHKTTEVFSDKGDSGSLVWHSKDDKGYMVGQLHSGSNKGGLSSNHVTYCTPGWFLLEQIRRRFKYADFYKTTW